MTRLAVLLGLAVLMIGPPVASADIQISYSIDGGAAVVCSAADASQFVQCANVPGPPLKITALNATSNWPGTASLSQETSSTVDVENNTAASHTLDIFVSAQNFTLPVAPPNITLLSHIGGTVAVGAGANLLSFRSCIDAGDGIPSCPGTIQSGTGTPSITGTGSFQDDQTAIITTLASPYAIGEEYHLTLGAGTHLNFTGSTTLTPVPEPMSIGLLGGVVLLSSSLILRRKRSQAPQA